MEKKDISIATLLRIKAEKLIQNKPLNKPAEINEGDILKLLHELEVYSVELELQNEELLNAGADADELLVKNRFSEDIRQRLIHEFEINQIELELQNEELAFSNKISHEVAERYSDLFNFSSSGYLILSREGEILDTNFSGARLLGKDRFKLKGSLFGFFVTELDRPIYNDFIDDLFIDKSKLTCEVSITIENSKSINVLLTGILTPQEGQCLITIVDITERKQSSKYRELTREILQILNEPGDIKDSLHRTLTVLKERTGFNAVGIRLQEGSDFPYLEQAGFSADFILTENSLIERDNLGKVCLDKNEKARMACTCGLVISGNAGPTDPNVTPGGSWWTNDSFPILNVAPHKDVRYHPRNTCIHEGYASIALVPIRANDKTVGLIQFNDYRNGVFNQNKIEFLEGIASHIAAALMRKQAEETLRKNEELLRTITENAPDIIIQLDESGTILYMNRSFSGRSKEDCIGKNFCTWTLQEYHDLMKQSLQFVFGASTTQTYLSQGNDIHGDLRWYRTSMSPVMEGEVVKNAILITRDITESILSEEILRESEQKRKTILMTAMDGFWIIDRVGCILEVNEAYSRMIGYTRQELLTMRIQDIEVAESVEETKAHIQRIIKLGEERFETRHRCKDGSIIHIDASVQYRKEQGGQFVAFLHDITNRLKREKAMFESNEQFRLLFENSQDAILFTNPDGTINLANPEAERMLGRSKEEIISLKRDEISDITDPRLELALEERKKKGHFKGELNYLRKDGTSFPVDVTSTIFKDSNGIERSSIIARDITERKKAEELLRQSNERYKSLFQDNHSVMLLIHPETGKIVDANLTACTYYGWSHTEMCNFNIDEINTLSKEEIACEMQLAKEEQRNHFFFRHRRATNEIRDVEVYSGPIRFGEETMLYSLVHDITERKQNEEALHQSENRYKSLFQNNHSVMLLLNPDSGEVVDANPSACNFYGWSHSELCQKNISEIDPLPKEELNLKLQNSKKERANHLFVKHMLANGELRDVEIYSGPIQFNESTLLYVIIHDITEKKIIEEALQKNKDNLRAILDATLESIYLFDKEGSVVEANITAATRLKRDIKEITGQKMSEFLPQETLQNRLSHLDEVFATEKPVQFEDHRDDYIFEHNFFPVFNNEKVEYVVSYSRDVTDSRKMEDSLKESEKKYRELIKYAPTGIYEVDTRTQKFLTVNDVMTILSGYSQEELLSMNMLDILYDESKILFMSRVDSLLKGELPNENVEYKIKAKDGHAIYATLDVNFTFNEEHEVIGATVVGHDITERVKMEAALRGSEQKLSEIYASMSEGLAIHELIFDSNGKAVDYLMLEVNPAYEKITGIHQQDVVNRKATELYSVEEAPYLDIYAEVECTSISRSFETYFPSMNKYFSISVFSPGKGKFVTVFRDITTQKRASEALRISERQLDAVFNSVTETIMMLDINGHILTANQTAAKRWGLSVEEMIGKNMFAFTSPETQKKREEQIQKMIETETPVRFEDERDGAVFDLTFYPIKEPSGEINQFVVFNRDITDRRRAQEALRANEERYSMIYNSSRDSIFSLDIDGYITSANRSFCEEFKLDLSQVLKKTFKEIGLPGYLCNELDNLKKQVKETNSTILSELTVHLSDNSTRYYEVILNPMHDDKGDVAGFGGSVRNITKRKEVSYALIESEKRFRHLIKDIPVGVLLYGPQAELTTYNPKALDLLGLSESQLKDNSLHEINWNAIHENGSTFRNMEYPASLAYSTGQSVRDAVIGINQSTNEITWLLMNAEVVSRSDGSIRNIVCSFIDITRMKKAENALKESEEKFRNLIWDMQVGVLLNGPDSKVLVCNPKAIELLGLTEDQILGKTSYDAEWKAIHEDGSPFEGNTHPVVQAIATGKPVRDVIMGVFQPILKKYVWLLIDAVPKFDKDGKLLNALVTFIDITTLKNTQNELKQSEFFFRESQQAAFIGSYKTDFNTGIWESSEVLDDIFGIDQMYDRTVEGWLNIAHPEDREMINHYLMEDVLMKGDQFNKEYRIIRKSDHITRWVHGLGRVDFDTNSKVKSLFGTIQDITDRKIKEEALRKLNRTLAALSKSSQAMSQSSDETEYLNQVCNIVVEDTDFAMVWIGYAEDDAAKTIRPIASAGFNDDYLEKIKLSWDDNEFGRGPTGVAIRTGEVGMCNNMFTDPAFEPWREQALKRGYASSIVFPLKTEDKIFGAITIYSKKPDSFLDDEIKLLTKLASDLAHGIATIRLREAREMAEEALIKSHNELESTVKLRTAELLHTNEVLKLTEEKYRTVSDFATNWEFWIARDDHMIYCSPSCERITGYSSTEFMQDSHLIIDIIHPDDLQTYQDHKNEELKGHVCEHEIQYRIYKRDGSIRWIGHFCRPVFDEKGNFRGIRGSNKDITSRKKMEELLTTSNQKYKLLSENINDGIFICKNGKFEYSNAAIYDIFGYSDRELEKMKLTELVMTDYHEELENLLYSTASSNKSCNVEIECLRKDFTTVFVEMLLNYVAKDKTVYGVVHDITEKKEFQKNMVKAIIQTEEKERAHFSKELHDGLGPLLSTIKLYLQWSERPNSNKSREEIIGKAGEILEEALATVKEVSNKLSPHLLTNYGINSAIKSFVEKLNATANYKIVFESNTTRRIGAETEAALYRATIECINNTLKYAHANNIFIKLEDTGSQIMLRYRDDGKGFDITETIAEHKGLGLFNLQNRLHTIGGKVELHSEPGKGVDYLFTVNV